jgi:hypothetical protein
VSWDASMLDVPDSDTNRAAFIQSRNRKGGGAFGEGAVDDPDRGGHPRRPRRRLRAELRAGPGPAAARPAPSNAPRRRTQPNATPTSRHQHTSTTTSTSSRIHTHELQQRLSSWHWA